MIEVYRNTAERIDLKLYVSGARVNSTAPVTVVVADSDGTVLTPSANATVTTDSEGEVYSTIINLDVTDYERTLKVTWTYAINSVGGNRVDTVEVVTPYCTPDEVFAYDPNVAKTFSYEQVKAAEQIVRRVIDSYTNQHFGMYTGTKTVIGGGDDQQVLSDRLISVSKVDGYNVYTVDSGDNGVLYRVRGDGYVIGTTVEPDQVDDIVYNSSVDNVIHAPFQDARQQPWLDNYEYRITGTWGYETVPTEVNQAALILIQQQLCPDTEYRDRYIDNIRAADWRYEFNPLAFAGTGNATADRLLDPYRRWSMTVI